MGTKSVLYFLLLKGLLGAVQLAKSRLLIKTPLNSHNLSDKVHTFLYDWWSCRVLFSKDMRMFCKGQNKACSCNEYCRNTMKYLHRIHSTPWNRFCREEELLRLTYSSPVVQLPQTAQTERTVPKHTQHTNGHKTYQSRSQEARPQEITCFCQWSSQPRCRECNYSYHLHHGPMTKEEQSHTVAVSHLVMNMSNKVFCRARRWTQQWEVPGDVSPLLATGFAFQRLTLPRWEGPVQAHSPQQEKVQRTLFQRSRISKISPRSCRFHLF